MGIWNTIIKHMDKFTNEGSYSLDFKGSIPFRSDIQRILMAFEMEAINLPLKY